MVHGVRAKLARRGYALAIAGAGFAAGGAVAAVASGRAQLAVPILALPPLVLLLSRRMDALAVLTLYVLLLFLVPSRLVVGPLGATGTPANIVGLLALLWWGTARLVPEGEPIRGVQPVRLAVMLFGAAVLASFVAANLALSDSRELTAATRAVLAAAAVSGPCLLAADGISSRARLDSFLRRIVGAVTFVAALGITQFFTGVDIAGAFRLPGLTPNYSFGAVAQRSIFNRVQSTAIHPIEFGVVLAFTLPLAIYLVMTAGRGRRLIPGACAAIIACGLPASVSRSAVLGIITAGIMLLAGWNCRQRLQALKVTLAFLVVVRLGVPGLLGTLRSLFTNILSDPSTTGRTDDYSVVGRFIKERPVFGRGMFTFLPGRYVVLDNQYLLAVVEMGFVGLAALLLLYLIGIFSARGSRRRSTDEATRQLGQALAGGLAAAMVTAATFDSLSFPMATGTVFLLLGATGALWRLTGGPEEVERALSPPQPRATPIRSGSRRAAGQRPASPAGEPSDPLEPVPA